MMSKYSREGEQGMLQMHAYVCAHVCVVCKQQFLNTVKGTTHGGVVWANKGGLSHVAFWRENSREQGTINAIKW